MDGEARAFGHLLVTGGAGFIGSCYVRDVLGRRDGTRITVLDKLTYAGNEANLAPVRDDPELAARFDFVRGDIADPTVVGPLVAAVDAVVNFAAESHVDRSILDPEAFLPTGVIGVHVLLEACRTAPGRPRFLQVSTDEVYGSVDEGHATEDAPLAPRSPYAAAKAAGELLVRSYVVTHGVDAVVTRGSNTYGPYHHPEKLIPLFITNALDDRPLPLYGDGLQRRDWLYVGDHAAAIDFVLRHGEAGETYNVAGPTERTNREVVALLLERLGKPWSLVRQVEDRPGHDRRYAMDGVEAGRARLASARPRSRTAWPRRSTGSAPTRRGGARPDRATGTAGTSASTAGGWRPARPPRPRPPTPAPPRRATDAGRRHRRGRRLGERLVAALADAPFTGPAGPIAWTRAAFDLDAPEAIGALLDSRPARGRRPRRGLDRRRRLRARPGLALRRNATATGVLAEACAARGIDLLIVSTNEVFDGSRTDGPARADRAAVAGQSVRRLEGRGRAAGRGGLRRTAGAGLGIARTAWLFGAPGRDFPSRILDAAERARPPASRFVRSATSGGRRPTPPTSPRRSSSCSRTTRSPGSTTSSTACPPRGPTGRATSSRGPASTSRSSTFRRPPGRVHRAAALGRPRADAAAVRRAAAGLAGRDGRLRAGPAARGGIRA